MEWSHEDINIEGVGVVRLTGDTQRVLASMPGDAVLAWNGIPFRLHASWAVQEGVLGQSDAWMLGKQHDAGAGLSDGEVAQVRDLLEEAVDEWLSDPQAAGMLAENAARSMLTDAQANTLRQRFHALQEMADGVDPYATMDALREAAVIASRLGGKVSYSAP